VGLPAHLIWGRGRGYMLADDAMENDETMTESALRVEMKLNGD
jgi:hypothetical protein